MRSDDAHLTSAFDGGFNHVADDGIIALALGRHAAMKPVELVRIRRVRAPLVRRERRIGHDGIKLHLGILLDEFRIVDGVAPFNPRRVLVMHEHGHESDSSTDPRARKFWSQMQKKEKRAITQTEHEQLVASVGDSEWRL